MIEITLQWTAVTPASIALLRPSAIAKMIYNLSICFLVLCFFTSFDLKRALLAEGKDVKLSAKDTKLKDTKDKVDEIINDARKSISDRKTAAHTKMMDIKADIASAQRAPKLDTKRPLHNDKGHVGNIASKLNKRRTESIVTNNAATPKNVLPKNVLPTVATAKNVLPNVAIPKKIAIAKELPASRTQKTLDAHKITLSHQQEIAGMSTSIKKEAVIAHVMSNYPKKTMAEVTDIVIAANFESGTQQPKGSDMTKVNSIKAAKNFNKFEKAKEIFMNAKNRIAKKDSKNK